jgi:DNA-binding CsgD family transcriptional regulator
MKFRMSDIAGQILSNIRDIVIILNPDRTFMDANVSFTKKISRSLNSLRKHRIDDYIIMDGILEKKFEELQMSKKNSLTGRIIYQTDSDHLITDSYISRITDAFNDFTGFLIVSKENRGIADLRTQYNITEKQFRIIELLINGLSNREISEKLGIHKRTVETHVLSIYNKLGVNNRIELLNLINEYYIQK